MANIRINSLPPTTTVMVDDVLVVDGATTRKIKPIDALTSIRPFASQAEAEAGVNTVNAMNPLRTAQAIAAKLPSSAPGRALLNAPDDDAQRALLALGDAATRSVGTIAGSVAAGDDVRFQPVGGTLGQALVKQSGADFDSEWTTLPALTGGLPPSLIDITLIPGWGGTATQNSTAISSAIALAVSRGGATILLPAGAFDINSPISITSSGVILRGARPCAYTDTAGIGWGTKLKYTGSSTTDMIVMSAVSGGGNYALRGSGLENLWIDANGLASNTISLASLKYCNFKGLYITGASTSWNLYLDVVASLAEAPDLQNCNFDDIIIAATGSVHAMGLDGDSIANTSFNNFRNMVIFHVNGGGIGLLNADNNDFYNIRCFDSGSGTGVVFGGGTSSPLRARTNTFYRLFASGGVTAQGTGGGITHPSYDNKIYDYDLSNGSPVPSIGTAATLTWHPDTAYSKPTFGSITILPDSNGAVRMMGFTTTNATTFADVTLPIAINPASGLLGISLSIVGVSTALTAPVSASLTTSTNLRLSNSNASSVVVGWTITGLGF